ncbi:MAG: hypothetical protein L0216_10090 [Planctomycetales bacterium]|nr:hypothetical protein [Planctomycetales bacterium]
MARVGLTFGAEFTPKIEPRVRARWRLGVRFRLEWLQALDTARARFSGVRGSAVYDPSGWRAGLGLALAF